MKRYVVEDYYVNRSRFDFQLVICSLYAYFLKA